MVVRSLIVGAALVLSIACSDTEPTWEWPEATPAEQGMDPTILEGARTYAFQDGKNTQGVVVTRRGVLVAEWYTEGKGPDSYAGSWSVAKSIVSSLIGMAIEDGSISGIDVPLTDYYPSWVGTERDQITLQHVLHQSTGLQWDESYDLMSANDSDAAQLVLTTESPLQYVLDRPVAAAVDTVFNYSSGNSLLFAGILEQATGMSAGEFAERRLFSQMGIEGAQWWKAKTGETLTYCCVDMTSRDFARFGLLYLNNGEWDGKQLVPADWVAASLSPSSVYAGYGYQWWLIGPEYPDLPDDLYAALGHDGQFVYVIPSLELVVVRNGFYLKDVGEPIADPTLFLRYPSGNLIPGGGTIPPDEWSATSFLRPIIDSIVD